MSRDEEALLTLSANDARRRLHGGFESGRGLIEQYRAKFLTLKAEDEFSRGLVLLASMAPYGRH